VEDVFQGVKMTKHATYASTGLTVWKELYVAALFEADKIKIEGRIADAEKAVAARARELFRATGDHIEEQENLDDALYALRALRNSWEQRLKAPRLSDASSRAGLES
jgi:hypothetical protein